MNIHIVVQTLQELSGWLEGSKHNQEKIKEIIAELESPDIDELKLQQLKFMLSAKMLFHPKWLGDVYVPNFVGDGTPFAWPNYLSRVADICKENL